MVDVDYLQASPHILPECRWMKVCDAQDLPMITEAAVLPKDHEIRVRSGVIKVTQLNVLFSTDMEG